jgi:hypothetical protein
MIKSLQQLMLNLVLLNKYNYYIWKISNITFARTVLAKVKQDTCARHNKRIQNSVLCSCWLHCVKLVIFLVNLFKYFPKLGTRQFNLYFLYEFLERLINSPIIWFFDKIKVYEENLSKRFMDY